MAEQLLEISTLKHKTYMVITVTSPEHSYLEKVLAVNQEWIHLCEGLGYPIGDYDPCLGYILQEAMPAPVEMAPPL